MFKRHLFAVSVHENQFKFQNTSCFIIGQHLNIDQFLRDDMSKKMTIQIEFSLVKPKLL